MSKPFVINKKTGYARNNTISFSLNEKDLIEANLLTVENVYAFNGRLIHEGVCMELVKSTLQIKRRTDGAIFATAKFRL